MNKQAIAAELVKIAEELVADHGVEQLSTKELWKKVFDWSKANDDIYSGDDSLTLKEFVQEYKQDAGLAGQSLDLVREHLIDKLH